MPIGIYKRIIGVNCGLPNQGFKKGHKPTNPFQKGHKSGMTGKKHTEESKEKNRLAHLGRTPWNKGKRGEYTTSKRGKKFPQFSGENHPMYGKHHTKEAKEKIGLVQKGNKNVLGKHWKLSEEAKRKIGLANKGKKRTEEFKQKISKLHKGKQISEELKEKLRKANLGRKQSPESIQKRVSKCSGKNHWNWKGGVSGAKRKNERNDSAYCAWVREIKKRDKQCQLKNVGWSVFKVYCGFSVSIFSHPSMLLNYSF